MTTIASLDLSRYIGATIGTVTLVKVLGTGSMGAVFIGYQASLKRQVAVKILPKELAASPKAQKMFRDEAETIGILNHPNIVPVYEMGETEEFFFQVMQLVVGQDLRSIIMKARKHPIPAKRMIPLADTVSYLIQVLDALGYAHDEGVYHQDIKPANILIDDRFKRPIVADFGVARTVWAEYGAHPVLCGTPVYISPEQAAQSETDGRTDIYSVGVILMEMATGGLPIHQESADAMMKRKIIAPDSYFTSRPSVLNPAVDRELEEIILTATASLADNRFVDCYAFKSELEQYARRRDLL